jgi:hypothetical protein
MKVCLNDRTIDMEDPQPNTVADLLEALRQGGQIPPAHVVVDISVDDRAWTGQDLSQADENPLPHGCTVSIGTDDVRGHARRVLQDARQMLEVLVKAARDIARDMLQQDPKQANSGLYRLLDSVQNLVGCLCQVQNICELECGPRTDQTGLLEATNRSLEAIRQRQENEDWKGLARVLEAQFPAALEGLREITDDMMGEL